MESKVLDKVDVGRVLTSAFEEIARVYREGDKIRFVNSVDALRVILVGNGKARPKDFEEAYNLWADLREVAVQKGILFWEVTGYDTGNLTEY